MTLRTKGNVGNTSSIGATEMRALRRLAEPNLPAKVEPQELWAARYRILEPIGQGGMGEVFLARDVLLDRLVALKMLRNRGDDESPDDRLLLREARAAARAEHERIARIYDAGTWNDRPFIAMEYVRGETLREWLKTHQPMPDEVLFITQQLLEGVRALHERGLVHRDLKPENIMVAPDGNLRILDLGIARRLSLSLDESVAHSNSASIGVGVGTPGYMAPEQWQALEIDARADLFAVGVIIYELVVGQAPFKAENHKAIREKTLTYPLPFDEPQWSSFGPALLDSTRGLLERDRERRIPTVERAFEGLTPLLYRSSPPTSASRSPIRSPEGVQPSPADSLKASALGVSVRSLPVLKRRFSPSTIRRSVLGIVAVSAALSGAARYRSASRIRTPPTPGMIRLEGGTFTMGSDAEDLVRACKHYPKGCPDAARNEMPKHQATVETFEIDRREVTNREFAEFLNSLGGSEFIVAPDIDDGYDRFVRYTPRKDDLFLLYDLFPETAGIEFRRKEWQFHAVMGRESLPVTQVSWLAARLFCKSLAKRLPTENEWEFASAGPQRRPFSWGTRSADCRAVHIPCIDPLSTVSDISDQLPKLPFAVMSAPQDSTPEGVKDLAGNVAEWVDPDDSVNADEGAYRKRLTGETTAIVRGGSFDSAFRARSAARIYRLAFDVAVNLGFRCVRSTF